MRVARSFDTAGNNGTPVNQYGLFLRYRYRAGNRAIPVLTDGVITPGVSLGTVFGNEMRETVK